MNPPIPFLLAGDLLFYSPSSLVGWWIATKTWTEISHCEFYIGGDRVIAARSAGVNVYSTRLDDYLVCIRRPLVAKFDLAGAYKALAPLMGPYELTGLLSFYAPWHHSAKASRICSSVATVALRGGGCEPFNPDVEASDVSPAQLWQSRELETVWKRAE